MRSADALRLAALASLWGGSFLFMRIAAPELGAAWVAFGRVLIAAVLLLIYAKIRGVDLQLRRFYKEYLVLGFFQSALPFFLFATAETKISAGLGSILNATSPLFGLIIGMMIGDEKVRIDRILGIFVGIAGVAILAGFDVGVLDVAIVGAIACCLGAACSYGISSNYTRRYVNGAPSLGMAAFSQTAAVLWLLPLAILYPPSGAVGSDAIVAVTLLGVLATGIAYILFFRLVVDVGPVVSLTVTFLVPIMAFLWGALFLNEQITLITIVGGGVVLLGTALTIGIEKLRPQPSTT